MATKITAANFSPTALAAIVGPAISSVQITSSNTYATVLDDTAVSLTGGYIVLNGTGFITGCQVYLDSTVATSVTFVSSTRVNVQVPAMAAGTYVMYLLNGDGSIAIRVNGLTYSLNPTWATSSDLGSVTFGNAISLQLAAPSDTTITYTLQAGSTLPTGLTLSSAGLLSGTVTIESATTYNFTVVATDVELQDSPRTFSVSITLGDLYFKNTVLLLNGETATTNWISDASTNSFNIIPTGDAKPSAFSPYNTSWSNYFDGTGDYLSVPSSANLSPGAVFTFEAWIYATSLVSGAIIYGANTNSELSIGYQTTTGWGISARGISWVLTSATMPISNQWNHIVVSRAGTGTNQTSLFLNGVRVANGTAATAFNVTSAYQVGYDGGGGGVAWNGYISNLRLVPGVDVYGYTNTTITIPTAPLTAVANTQLLTCQSNRFKDGSTNNFTLTPTGDVAVKTFSPFAETDTVTGSGYFDGSGDYLTIANNSAFDFGTSNFTVEFWIYKLTTGDGAFISGGSSSGSFDFVYTETSLRFGRNSIAWDTTVSFTFVPYQWYHIAFVKESAVAKIYINGSLAGSASNTNSYNTAGGTIRINVSADGSRQHNAYISNLRVVNGTAVYTAAFTPPTAALTAVTNTKLLSLQNRQGHNNSAFLDTSGNKFNVTRNGNATQGTFTPFSQAGWSVYFDGTGDYLKTGTATPIATTQSTFTVEAFIYMTANPSSSGNPNIPAVVGDMAPDGGAANWTFGPTSSRALSFYWYTGSLNSAVGNTIMALNAWHHIAVSVSANAIKLFVNGVLQTLTGTTTLTNRQETLNYIGFGQCNNTNHVFTGYASNMRIVSGTALYTTTFTPSTVALTAVANTALLTCQSNRFKDNSTNNFTLTATGDAKVQAFSPFTPNGVYSAATHGGSAYFDATGDSLVFPNSSNFSFGTSAYTVEFWVYLLSYANTNNRIIDLGVSANSWGVQINNNGTIAITKYGAADVFTSPAGFVLNSWNHIAIVRSSTSTNDTKIYLNGVVLGTTTDSNTWSVGTTPKIGDISASLAFSGYLSNLRVVNGAAVYTATFTPPTAPLTAITNTSLLLSGTNAGVIDQSGRTDLETVGDARISTAVKKYGTGSMYFDGTGDYLYAASSPNFELSSGDFTVEAWIYPTTIAGAERGIFGIGTTDPDSNLVRIQGSSAKLQFWLGGSNGGGPGAGTKTGIITCGTVLSLNTWYHIALVRSGSATNNVKLYLNGVSDGQGTATYNIGAKPFGLGLSYPNSAIELFIGHIDEFRITRGVARYTATFTPPTTEVLTK